MDESTARAHELGRTGETLAARHLAGMGFEILERNVRLESAEIDLVARDRHGLVFVEVKARSSTRGGFPYEAVTEAKRRRVQAAALRYVAERRLGDVDFRFGIVSIVVRNGQVASLEWVDEA